MGFCASKTKPMPLKQGRSYSPTSSHFVSQGRPFLYICYLKKKKKSLSNSKGWKFHLKLCPFDRQLHLGCEKISEVKVGEGESLENILF